MQGRLFLDMDGVLADFDAGYERQFGVRPDKGLDDVDWDAVAATPDFYLNLPPMPDFPLLWAFARKFEPTVITGMPSNVEQASSNKTAWAVKHLGMDVPVICCRSSRKSRYCQTGDVLVDDREKYRDLWLKAGGRWITHRSAGATICELTEMGFN